MPQYRVNTIFRGSFIYSINSSDTSRCEFLPEHKYTACVTYLYGVVRTKKPNFLPSVDYMSIRYTLFYCVFVFFRSRSIANCNNSDTEAGWKKFAKENGAGGGKQKTVLTTWRMEVREVGCRKSWLARRVVRVSENTYQKLRVIVNIMVYCA